MAVNHRPGTRIYNTDMPVRAGQLAATVAVACLPLLARNPEGNLVVPGAQGDIVYRRIGSTTLALDAYVQQRDAGRARDDRRPGVIVVHGGGGDRGSRVSFVPQFLEMLTRDGYPWVSIDYRLGVPQADAVDDVRAAVDFVRCHARELRIDAERLVLFGEEYGADLVARLAAAPPPGVKAAVLVGASFADDAAAAAPVAAGGNGPATLVVHGTADTTVPPAKASAYCDRARAAGRACTYLPVEGATHRAENWLPALWGYKAQVRGWLSRTLAFEAPHHRPYVTRLQKDIVYAPELDLKLDAYTPRGTGPFPAVIVAHGGGWEGGDKVTYIAPLFDLLARAGFAWFSIDYRPTPVVPHPRQLDDLRQAIRFVRANAARFHIDPRRLALLGESASGQMVVQIATEVPPPNETLAGVVSLYGVYDFEPLARQSASTPRPLLQRLFARPALDDESLALLRAYSPIHHLKDGMPPVLLIHGTNESLWAQGQAMDRALAAKGLPHELIAVEGAPHGLENWEGRPEWMQYKPKLAAWLRQHVAR